MSFWRYFKGKLLSLGYLLLGVAAMAFGAWLIVQFGLGKNIFQLSLDTVGCATGGLIVIVGGIVIAYGQKRLQKLDE